ncbi:TRAP transporter small permease subunit [Thalassotalea sp. ND16A]|uniref:TRAP transporter small permease subunit n=1 Tax=Thalassotalea sp. ND16A TaxID=1535422 RepID=UPI00051D3B1D|nr:TRAP transporter small permease subunit [Thalassotalea sp. ND16A]KGK00593.1 hypothetical protein ND16A_3353 [Thalassotalea sp. ND16A]
MSKQPPSQASSLTVCLLKTSDTLERIIKAVSAICCWSSALLMAVIVINVIMRYGFNNGLILFEEIQWHLYAIGIMFGLSHAEITNSQVRVDVVAAMLKPKTVIKWEIFGAIAFVFPMIFVVIFNSWDYVATAYQLNESSVSPLGLPYRWIIKAVIPVSFLMLALAVLARLFRNIISLYQPEA